MMSRFHMVALAWAQGQGAVNPKVVDEQSEAPNKAIVSVSADSWGLPSAFTPDNPRDVRVEIGVDNTGNAYATPVGLMPRM